MIKDNNFFDAESEAYSLKRYVERPASYTQFFFKERLRLVLKILRTPLVGKRDLSFLEIGCADGIILDEVYDHFGEVFSSLAGIDTSSRMIEAASKRYPEKPFVFKVRENFSDRSLKDVIVEIGVINYAAFEEELDFASSLLKESGTYIISLAGRDSLWNRMKKVDKGFRNFLSYAEYEREVRKRFEIICVMPVGFFIPYIWKIPFLARGIQPLEKIFRTLAPNLFHEKIYLLKKTYHES